MRAGVKNRLAVTLALLCMVAVATQRIGSADGETRAPPESAPMTLERLATMRIPKVCDFPAAVYSNCVHPEPSGCPWP